MRMKSYFAGSVQIAMEQARRELGSEAILVTSRFAPAEVGKPRQYEVVFATEIPEKTVPKQVVPAVAIEEHAASGEGAVTSASLQAVLREVRGLRQEIQTWLPRGTGDTPRSNAEREILSHLTNADVNPDLAQELMASAIARLANRAPAGSGVAGGRFADVLRAASSKVEHSPQDLRAALAACIADVFRMETGLESLSAAASSRANQGPLVLAMIGPPGAGKTSAIAKIAVRCGMGRSKPTLLLSADNLRIAASEQLRGYAAVLGLRFDLAQSTRALGQLIEDHRGYGLILIDTPGFSGGELSEAGELARFLADEGGIQKHLILPAPARCADLDRIWSAYEIFAPTHLLFSRTDETTVFGPALGKAVSSGLPVSFFGTGTRVPEDISEASAGFIADRLLPAQVNQKSMPAAA
jgi:flagellar biosynthesis GTPase FlhF